MAVRQVSGGRQAIRDVAARGVELAYRRAGYTGELRRVGSNLQGLCPFHQDDKTPSLRITAEGKWAGFWRCFGACQAGGDLVAFWRRLHGRGEGKASREDLAEVQRLLGLADLADAGGRRGHGRLMQTRWWAAVDEEGKEFARHRRRDYEDGHKAYCWKRGAAWSLKPFTQNDAPLYRLPDLLAAEPEATVLVTEGEKDADAAAAAGFLVVSTYGADTRPTPAVLKHLLGHDVVLWPDADAGGRKLMAWVGAQLAKAGTVPRILEWPEAPAKGGAADWFAAGKSAADLREVIAAARPAGAAGAEVIAEGSDLTDSHNAERLVARYGEAIRYCKAAGTWYIYDGMRWRPDVLDAVMEFAKTTARGIHTEAADADDPREQRAKGKHAVASQSKTKLRSMIDLAQSIPQVAVRPENFDSRRDLLNTPNGTLNLTTFELQAHDPADLLTVITSAPYDPEARNDLWEDFLSRTTGGSPELQAFLQRAVGYTLSGRCSEEVCFYAYGPTASGKTTFAMALLAALGDGYGRSANFDTFLRRDAPTIYDDLARLVGARFVAAMETRDGATFNEGLLKSLTGRDPVTVRHLYQAWFTYVPQYVIWFGANMRARVAADDAAIWRRIIQLPFSNSVPAAERDPELKERLQDCRTCGAAILRWAIDGLKEWQRRRLAIPDGVRRATDEYQASQNPAADFVDDCCVRADTAWASSTALWEAYQHWAQGGGLKYPLTFRRFSRALEGMGCVPDRRGTPQQRGWAGVGLLAEGAQDT